MDLIIVVAYILIFIKTRFSQDAFFALLAMATCGAYGASDWFESHDPLVNHALQALAYCVFVLFISSFVARVMMTIPILHGFMAMYYFSPQSLSIIDESFLPLMTMLHLLVILSLLRHKHDCCRLDIISGFRRDVGRHCKDFHFHKKKGS